MTICYQLNSYIIIINIFAFQFQFQRLHILPLILLHTMTYNIYNLLNYHTTTTITTVTTTITYNKDNFLHSHEWF